MKITATVPFRVLVDIDENNDVVEFEFTAEVYRETNGAGATIGWGVLNSAGDGYGLKENVGRKVVDALMDFAQTLGKD